MTPLFLYFFFALAVSFLCSLLESVLLSISHTHIAMMEKDGQKSAKILKRMKESINRPLAAILTLNTVANTVGAAGVGAQAYKLFGSEWVAVASGILTLSILIFSEIIPKTLGASQWKSLAGVSAYLIQIMIFFTYPFVLLLQQVSGRIGPDEKQEKVTREEIGAMAEIGEDEGAIEEHEGTIIENLLRLDNITAEEVLTPKSVIFALQKDQTVGEVLDKNELISFSRIPVYGESLDDIIGIVRRYHIIKSKAEDKFHVTMEDLAGPVFSIDQKTSVADTLDLFVQKREHLFIVTDEFGTTVGLITLEDAIETLLGVEIVDEFDSVEDMRKLAIEEWRKKRMHSV